MLEFSNSDSVRKAAWLDAAPSLPSPRSNSDPSHPGPQLLFQKEEVDSPGSLKPLSFVIFWKTPCPGQGEPSITTAQLIVNIREGNGWEVEKRFQDPEPRGGSKGMEDAF